MMMIKMMKEERQMKVKMMMMKQFEIIQCWEDCYY